MTLFWNESSACFILANDQFAGLLFDNSTGALVVFSVDSSPVLVDAVTASSVIPLCHRQYYARGLSQTQTRFTVLNVPTDIPLFVARACYEYRLLDRSTSSSDRMRIENSPCSLLVFGMVDILGPTTSAGFARLDVIKSYEERGWVFLLLPHVVSKMAFWHPSKWLASHHEPRRLNLR